MAKAREANETSANLLTKSRFVINVLIDKKAKSIGLNVNSQLI